jgi:predicted ester cyclase
MASWDKDCARTSCDRLFRMAANENRAFVRRWFDEVWNHGRADLIDEMSAPDTVATGLGHSNVPTRGMTPFKAFYTNMRATFPDLHVRVEEIVAEGDLVVVRLTAEGTHTGDALAPATGRKATFGALVMARIADGRIVEAWNAIDQLGILHQIGAVPSDLGPERFIRTPK